jgi:hypothetical protein
MSRVTSEVWLLSDWLCRDNWLVDFTKSWIFRVLFIDGEQGILCCGLKGLSPKKEDILDILLGMVLFDYGIDINSFELWYDYMPNVSSI